MRNRPLIRLFHALAKFARSLDYLVEVVYPSSCLLCGTPTPRAPFERFWRRPPLSAILCPECRKKLVSPTSQFCKRCARPVLPWQIGEYCGQCQEGVFAFDEARPLQFYRGLTRGVVLRLKRDRDGTLAYLIARLYFEERRDVLEAFQPDCVVAVPMNWRRKFLRKGINAPERVAELLAFFMNVPYAKRQLIRTRATPTQTSVSWEDRARNVAGAFAIRDVAQERPFAGKRVLLVDDALTTGATTHEISKLLRASGAEKICVAVIARAGLGKKRALGGKK